MRIIGVDVGNDLTVAVVVTIEDFQSMTPSAFFLQCDFIYCSPDKVGLEKLLNTNGDLYIMEPTGAYSRIWADNLAIAGKECRFVPHDKLSHYRTNCGWSDKDDEHDAVALAWYGWERLNRPNAFNRIRVPMVQAMFELFLQHKRIADEYTVICNQARNILHHECPELRSIKSYVTASGDPPPLWEFISGGDRLRLRQKTKYTKLKKNTIGSASPQRLGTFSTELKKRAARIVELELDDLEINNQLRQAIKNPEFDWYNAVFDKFSFGLYDRVLLLTQIYPFERMLNDSYGEIKLKHKRRSRSKSGKLPKRRVSYNLFHACLGKAPNQRSSGKKHGVTVNGSALCRSYLFLWGQVHIFRTSEKYRKTGYPWDALNSRYESSIKEAGELELLLAKALKNDESLIEQLEPVLRGVTGGETIMQLIGTLKDRHKLRLTPERIKIESKKVLGNWAKSRATDLAVKLLFRELLRECRNHHR